jgi:hypothetical protein
MKCTAFIRQHLEAYSEDNDLLKLLTNMISESRRYGTDTLNSILIKELERIYHELEVS